MVGTETILKGWTNQSDEVEAVKELAAKIKSPSGGSTYVFCSPEYNLDIIGAELYRSFGDSVVGCTTAGEITPDGYQNHSITGFTIPDFDSYISHYLLKNVSNLELSQVADISSTVAHLTKQDTTDRRIYNCFGLLLIDGLSTSEELVVGAIQSAMKDIPIVGGSAADSLRFEETGIFYKGRFVRDAALLSIVQTKRQVHTFKFQHFSLTDTKLVITKAIPTKRIVSEINGLPAAQEYARLIGQDISTLDSRVFSEFPILLKIGGKYYVRSIQRVNADGSLTFFCAIDEGLVLSLGKCQDIVNNLSGAMAGIQEVIADPDLIIGFECIFRRIEVESKNLTRTVGDLLAKNNVVGFNTYGEQFGAVHINQTFTGVAVGKSEND